jgi:hypothetical protein
MNKAGLAFCLALALVAVAQTDAKVAEHSKENGEDGEGKAFIGATFTRKFKQAHSAPITLTAKVTGFYPRDHPSNEAGVGLYAILYSDDDKVRRAHMCVCVECGCW